MKPKDNEKYTNLPSEDAMNADWDHYGGTAPQEALEAQRVRTEAASESSSVDVVCGTEDEPSEAMDAAMMKGASESEQTGIVTNGDSVVDVVDAAEHGSSKAMKVAALQKIPKALATEEEIADDFVNAKQTHDEAMRADLSQDVIELRTDTTIDCDDEVEVYTAEQKSNEIVDAAELQKGTEAKLTGTEVANNAVDAEHTQDKASDVVVLQETMEAHLSRLETTVDHESVSELSEEQALEASNLDTLQDVIEPMTERGTAVGDERVGVVNTAEQARNKDNGKSSDGVKPLDALAVVLPEHSQDSAPSGDYANSHYLLFGYETNEGFLALSDAFEYLKKYMFQKNGLRQAREKQDEAERIAQSYSPIGDDMNFCDFCGCELTGVEHETLKDGRERCNACSRTSVRTLEGFISIFNDVFRNMSAFFQIKINSSIRIRFASAEKIARKLRYSLKKESGFMPRAVGVAIKDRDGYSILIENGAPKLSAISTIAHELTHIWQYLNWDDKIINQTYGKSNSLIVYEGMAKWVEIQYLIFINEQAYSKRQEICTLNRKDEYGEGYKRYLAEYSLISGLFAPLSKTPFRSSDSRPLK